MNNFFVFIKKMLGESIKKIIIFLIFPFRNRFILFNFRKTAKNHQVNLDYCFEELNVGDMLSPIVVEYMLQKKHININKKIKKRLHLYAIGSILTAGIQDATVWGSGVLNTKLAYRLKHRKLDVRLIRGPLTGAILEDYGHNNPKKYGDPALLLPYIYNPQNIKKEFKYGLILHKDYNYKHLSNDKIIEINIKTNDYKKFIDKILSVDIVISSSLHGIILAESYGVPAILLKPQKDYIKYYDYYYSTGRMNFPVASSVDEAMMMEPANIPDFRKIRDNIENTFPYDIFL